MSELTVLGALVAGAKYAAFVVGFLIVLYLGGAVLSFLSGLICGFSEEITKTIETIDERYQDWNP